MSIKTFKIEFFKAESGEGGEGTQVSEILRRLAQQRAPMTEIGSFHYEIRDLRRTNNGAFYKGFLAKFRSDDLPHIARPGGNERNIVLESDEGLIEKNYFIYERRYELLTYQTNRQGSTPKILGEYLRQFSGESMYFQPVLHIDPMRRLLADEVRPKKLEVSFARPSANWISTQHMEFSDALMKLLGSAGGYRINLKISPPRKGLLNTSVKAIMRELLSEVPNEISVARVDVEDEGIVYPIDLIADRLRVYKSVSLEGRYPVPSEIYSALSSARDENASTIQQVFGT